MGYMRHDAIVVTCWDEDRLKAVHDFSKGLELPVSEIVNSGINDVCSFLVAPDGSKEGWAESDAAEEARAKLIAWMRENETVYYPEWVLVNYGGDDSHRCSIEDFAGKDTEEECQPQNQK